MGKTRRECVGLFDDDGVVVEGDVEFLKPVESVDESVYRLLLVPFHMKSQLSGSLVLKRVGHIVEVGCFTDNLLECRIVENNGLGDGTGLWSGGGQWLLQLCWLGADLLGFGSGLRTFWLLCGMPEGPKGSDGKSRYQYADDYGGAAPPLGVSGLDCVS